MREPSLLNAARFRSGMIDSYLSLYERVCTEGLQLRRVNWTHS